jgi:hypothetical protein
MNWNSYKSGHLASCSHGYYFIYRQFDEEVRSERWFAKYEPGVGVFGEHGKPTGQVHGFESLEDAKAFCEKNAKQQ